MYNESQILELLFDLVKRNNVEKLSGKPKEMLRYQLASIFVSVIRGDFKNNQIILTNKIEVALNIRNRPNKIKEMDTNVLNKYKETIVNELRTNHFHNVDNYSSITKIIKFFRDKLFGLREDKRFWKVEDLEELLSVQGFLQMYYPIFKENTIKNHHWIDFNIRHGIVPTYPELISYNDLINSWNCILETNSLYQQKSSTQNTESDELRMLEYSLFSFQRFGYTACVTFFEAYLYYIFYNFKEQSMYIDDSKINGLYRKNPRKITDEEILKKVIEPKFFNKKDKDSNQFKDFNKRYKKLNEIRNSIIHTSAFEDESNKHATMELFFELNINELRENYELIIDFTLLIESKLPANHKILFWWGSYEEPNFKSNKKIKNIRV